MALDGILLYKVIPGIQAVLPSRIQKIYQISSSEVLFQLHGSCGKQQLLISCHSQYNRMLLTKRNYPTPPEPGNFIMVLRKYLEGATLLSVDQFELDRWCVFKIRRHNDLGDLEELNLYVELMGKYANIILVRSDNTVIDALKRIPPFENSRRIIHPGAEFKPTPSQNKKNPFYVQLIEPGKTLTQQFSGFSPSLQKEIEFRMSNGQSFVSIMNEIKESTSLYISNQDNDAVFHCIPLTSVGNNLSYPLFEGFDILYFHKEEKERIKEISGDIYHICKKELKHQQMKLPRLLKEFDEAVDCDRWKKYGDLLYIYSVNDTKGQNTIVLNDYETEENIRIPLDPKLNGHANAQRCYTKYQKLKKGQHFISEQITITQNEINYFNGLIEQLDQADFTTASEIKDELIKGGYLIEKNQSRKKKKKEEALHVHTIITAQGIQISYGRNNLQNEFLTFKASRKNDIWLHAKDYHGAHVVIHSSSPDEDTLRLAANIAAYFSKGRSSSSVPVNYCPIQQLKKIPGAKPGMVQIGSYKTIYIDPDKNLLNQAGIETV